MYYFYLVFRRALPAPPPSSRFQVPGLTLNSHPPVTSAPNRKEGMHTCYCCFCYFMAHQSTHTFCQLVFPFLSPTPLNGIGPECVCQHPLVLYMEDAKIRRVWPIPGPASGLCHGSSPHESSHLRSGHCGASSRGQGDSGNSPERACRHSLTPQAPLGESGADRGGFLSLELPPIREQQDVFPIAGLWSFEVPPAPLKPNASHTRGLADPTAFLLVFSGVTRREEASSLKLARK